MASLVEARLIQPLLETGFEWVNVCYEDPDIPISGREICLERRISSDIESIVFNFDKYHRAVFQLHLHRRELDPPYRWVRSANLVRNDGQYLHFWGKPWWMPTRFWSERMSEQTVDTVLGHLEQVLAFLERGARGPNISKEINAEPLSGAQADAEN